MSFSTFEIIGPVMVGPSSSHTAGACRIGWVCRELMKGTPEKAIIRLHGSFLATGQGHATDEALVAGLLGFTTDDVRLKNSFEHAKKAQLEFSFESIDLGPQAHPNSAQLVLQRENFNLTVTAESVGGGAILIREIEPFSVEIRGTLEILVIWHRDTPGFLSRITAVLACAELNVASIRTSRFNRGEQALTVIEIDGTFPADVLLVIERSRTIERLVRIPVLPGL